jgi:hypothetical protein
MQSSSVFSLYAGLAATLQISSIKYQISTHNLYAGLAATENKITLSYQKTKRKK